MKQNRMKLTGRSGLACLMALVTALSVPVSANAHVVRKASWTMPLPAAAAELCSSLLTEEGQNIRINTVSNSYQIEIPILNEQNENWHMTVVSRSPEYMKATLTTQDFYWNKEASDIFYYHEEEEPDETTEDASEEEQDDGTQIVYLNLTRSGGEDVSASGDQTVEEANQTENTNQSDSTDQIGETVDNDQQETETETLSFYQADAESTADGSSSAEDGTTTEDGTTSEGGASTEGGTAEDSTTTEGDTSTETESTSTPSTVYVKVTLTYDMEMTDFGEFEEGTGKTLTATFYVPLKESEKEDMTGTLKSCPSQYNPEAAIPLMTGEKGCELKLNQAENKAFPALTRYTIGDGRTWVLYDGGTIRIPAKTAFAVDLSLTSLNPNNVAKTASEGENDGIALMDNTESAAEENPKLEIKAGNNTHNLEYVDVPTTNVMGMPFVLTGKDIVLQLPYQWGNAVPKTSIEQLKLQDGKLEWVSADDFFSVGSSTAGNQVQISKAGTPAAGTYRIEISWIENGMTLYNLKTVFYLQYGNAG